jgi:hypothetical protein
MIYNQASRGMKSLLTANSNLVSFQVRQSKIYGNNKSKSERQSQSFAG